ncbi:MAG: T9SS type A sorting domain-containing protein, partial [Cyclobacteriaceae bacterium]
EQLTAPTFEIQNLKNVEASINFRTEALFSSTDFGGVPITYQTVISKATPINITDNVIFANEHKTVRMDTLPDINNPLQFPSDPRIDSTLIRLTIALQTNDNIPFNNTPPVEPDSTGDYTPNYQPIQFTSNDTLVADYVLSSYYAYDDGVAEYAAGLIESGNLIAYQFEIDTTYSLKQDTLIGFDIYFPPYGYSSGQRVDFFIYHDKEGLPGDVWLPIRSVSIKRSGNNQFQRIQFLPALLIDESKFYIGWKQPSTGEILVGLDMSNDTYDKIFVNTSESWYQNEDVRGSLMIRPVFGSGVVDASVGIEEEVAQAVYPNPNRGSFFIDGHVDAIQINSLTGKKIECAMQPSGNRTEVRIINDAPGLYILRYKQDHVIKSKKILIIR